VTIQIRPYRPSDRPSLEALSAELLDAMVDSDPWGRLTRTEAYARTDVRMILHYAKKHKGFILVATDRGRPVGFAAGWISPTQFHRRQSEKPNRTGYVSDLAVLKDWRGKGIGTRLITTSEQWFRRMGCDTTSLGVFYPNARARRLYAACGYSPRSLFLSKRIGTPPATWKEALRGPEKHPKKRSRGRWG
jgi:GNAT superfamily N-acetyltransferase